MAYRLIALDLDNTILTSDKKIPQRVKDVISKARKKGIIIVVCTGRTRKGSLRFYEGLGLDTLLIASGGAEVFDSSGKALYTRYLKPECTRELLALAYEKGIHAQVYMNDELMFRERNAFSDVYEKNYGSPAIVVPDLIDKEIITPKVLYITEAENISSIRSEVNEKFPSLITVQSDPQYLEIVEPGVSKGSGLEFAAEYYGVDRSETIAIGDSEIDIPMLDYAGLGVAVSNAEPIAIEHADIICGSNEEAGAAEFIEKYLLEA